MPDARATHPPLTRPPRRSRSASRPSASRCRRAPRPTRRCQLAAPILARNRELSRRLADRPCAADRRIQAFLDDFLAGAPVQPQLPRRTLVLDEPGLARELTLPRDGDEFASRLVTSYRLANGVLHNPVNDRRTTAGVFHIAEGGLPIQDDKLAVPNAVYARLLEEALQPPAEDLVLPWTAGDARAGPHLGLDPAAPGRRPGHRRAPGGAQHGDAVHRARRPGLATSTSSRPSSATPATPTSRRTTPPSTPRRGPGTPAASSSRRT